MQSPCAKSHPLFRRDAGCELAPCFRARSLDELANALRPVFRSESKDRSSFDEFRHFEMRMKSAEIPILKLARPSEEMIDRNIP